METALDTSPRYGTLPGSKNAPNRSCAVPTLAPEATFARTRMAELKLQRPRRENLRGKRASPDRGQDEECLSLGSQEWESAPAPSSDTNPKRERGMLQPSLAL